MVMGCHVPSTQPAEENIPLTCTFLLYLSSSLGPAYITLLKGHYVTSLAIYYLTQVSSYNFNSLVTNGLKV